MMARGWGKATLIHDTILTDGYIVPYTIHMDILTEEDLAAAEAEGLRQLEEKLNLESISASIKELRKENQELRHQIEMAPRCPNPEWLGLEYRPIGGTQYAISSSGILRKQLDNGQLQYKLATKRSKDGRRSYPHYCINGTYRLCHHLVMEAWGEPKPTRSDGRKVVLRHLDDDPNNFDISNLKWGTGDDNWDDAIRNNMGKWLNGHYHHKQVLSVDQVLVILNMLEHKKSRRSIAKIFNVTKDTIRDIDIGKSWRVARNLYPRYKPSLDEAARHSYNIGGSD